MKAMVAVLFLLLPLSGCLDDPRVVDAVSTARIQVRKAGSNATWFEGRLKLEVENPVVHVPKPRIESPGGGIAISVPVNAINVSIEARLRPNDYNGRLRATWTLGLTSLYYGSNEDSNTTEIVLNGNSTATFNITRVGLYQLSMRVEAMDPGDGVRVQTEETFISVSGVYRYTSRIYPFRPTGPVQPPISEPMADEYLLPLAARPKTITAKSKYYGNWSAPQGTDIALELQDEDGKTLRCVDHSSQRTPSVNDAEETLTYEGPGGESWVIRAGLSSEACGGTFANTGEVSYAIEITIDS